MPSAGSTSDPARTHRGCPSGGYIAAYIGAIDGFIQCDDYKGYSALISLDGLPPRALVPPERRLGCMMHVRRRFHDALKLGDTRASMPIAILAAAGTWIATNFGLSTAHVSICLDHASADPRAAGANDRIAEQRNLLASLVPACRGRGITAL
ncbi:MAG: hypothetical protein RL701_622 [Pseudomonadota bacterium]